MRCVVKVHQIPANHVLLCIRKNRKRVALRPTPEPDGRWDFLTQTLPERWADGYIADTLGPLRSFFGFLYLGGVVDSVNSA